MAEQESVPPGPDARTPNMARMYDYALGGKDNFAADREAVQKLFSFAPENRDVPHLTREGHPPELVAQKEAIFAKSNAPVSYRSRPEILRMFDGSDLVEPGLTAVTQWRGDELDEKLGAAGQWWLGGVGRKN